MIHTYPDKEGVARKADVGTSSGILTRHVSNLVVFDVTLDSDSEEDFGRHEGEDVGNAWTGQ